MNCVMDVWILWQSHPKQQVFRDCSILSLQLHHEIAALVSTVTVWAPPRLFLFQFVCLIVRKSIFCINLLQVIGGEWVRGADSTDYTWAPLPRHHVSRSDRGEKSMNEFDWMEWMDFDWINEWMDFDWMEWMNGFWLNGWILIE